ncbi:AraC family transcriptional regulator [Sediminicola luteus]|uniref:AraC family transcriptional regulator n=1 Tax=Sediminicola luteus TaxID=319238 RepID=A0A2A4GGA0_9FLAO|nr:AraC family transcriptional regulator [Sediminicola luteus]PCE66795.1 AraC family transcriptional regulator [Sediminicola luteus]
MVTKFEPKAHTVYFINTYTLFHILEGKGPIQVDFKNYLDWQDKIIYLEKGQYIRFLSEGFVLRRIEFEEAEYFRNKEVRVLFKHLVSLGYINFAECVDCQKYLDMVDLQHSPSDIIDISTKQWFWQNPFEAEKEEYHLIFDVKEIIDTEFNNHISQTDIVALIQARGYSVQQLFQDKIGLSVKKMLGNKRLLESQKALAFTDMHVQEVAYEMGFKDPSYFNRQFKKLMGQSPRSFRKQFDYTQRDTFINDLMALLQQHYHQHRQTQFYAEEMHISVKTLEKKVREKLGTSLGQLIRYELLSASKSFLTQGATVKETAFALGFAEANHFSAFFRKHMGKSPSQYLEIKQNT